MNFSSVWRNVALVLVLVNVLFALWSGGHFGFLGLDPSAHHEAARLDDQVAPEALQLRVAGAAAAPASAAASQ